MWWSDIPFHPPELTLRQFAGLSVVCFLTLAAMQAFEYQRPERAIVVALLALAVGIVGLLRPSLIRAIYVGAIVITFPIGWTVSRLLLAVVFYAVITPIGLALRLLGRDGLNRHLQPGNDSYWEPRQEPASSSSYYRQY